ncbi:Zn(II)2Cys6 transcription factor [Aspergillus foveolatus]|uniref:Zn(II)2Cys6 transcription factor n=1 Tax=Aspergillus foveolatus TaxID=210207 RepID=UPI003CCCF8C3
MERRRAPYAHKACEACRFAKLRCNARTPSCSRCQKQGRPCVYRDRLRRRPGAVPLPLHPAPIRHRQDVYDDVLDRIFAPLQISRRAAPSEVGGTVSVSVSWATDLAIYQLLHELFHSVQDPPTPTCAVDLLRDRTLLFASDTVSPWDLLPFTTASNADLQFLPPDLAIISFNIYVSSLWNLNPFRAVDALQAALCDLYGVVGCMETNTADRANVLAILALGGSCTGNHDFARYAHQKSVQYASAPGARTGPIIDTDIASVQHGLLQISTYLALIDTLIDSPSRARLQRNLSASGNGWLSGLQTRDEMPTLIMLVAFERYVSLCVGRASNFLPDTDVHLPENAHPALSAISKFGTIASQIQSMHQKLRKDRDLFSLARASHALHARLNHFLDQTSASCRSLSASAALEIEILVCVLFHYCNLLLFRPFVTLKLLYTRTRNQESTSPPGIHIPPEYLEILERACPHAAHAARSLLSLIGQTFHSTGSALKDLPPNGLFLESACLSLILQVLCESGSSADSYRKEAYLADIRRGIAYLSLMSCQAAVADRIQGLRDLLMLVEPERDWDGFNSDDTFLGLNMQVQMPYAEPPQSWKNLDLALDSGFSMDLHLDAGLGLACGQIAPAYVQGGLDVDASSPFMSSSYPDYSIPTSISPVCPVSQPSYMVCNSDMSIPILMPTT